LGRQLGRHLDWHFGFSLILFFTIYSIPSVLITAKFVYKCLSYNQSKCWATILATTLGRHFGFLLITFVIYFYPYSLSIFSQIGLEIDEIKVLGCYLVGRHFGLFIIFISWQFILRIQFEFQTNRLKNGLVIPRLMAIKPIIKVMADILALTLMLPNMNISVNVNI